MENSQLNSLDHNPSANHAIRKPYSSRGKAMPPDLHTKVKHFRNALELIFLYASGFTMVWLFALNTTFQTLPLGVLLGPVLGILSTILLVRTKGKEIIEDGVSVSLSLLFSSIFLYSLLAPVLFISSVAVIPFLTAAASGFLGTSKNIYELEKYSTLQLTSTRLTLALIFAIPLMAGGSYFFTHRFITDIIPALVLAVGGLGIFNQIGMLAGIQYKEGKTPSNDLLESDPRALIPLQED